MMSHERRAFLSFLAASPLFAALAPWTRALADEQLPASAAEALDVFDLEAVAQRLVPPAHWGYLQSGVDGDVTLRANQTAYQRYELQPRRLVDVSHVDLATTVFGIKAASPIGCWPIGSLRALHPEGDIAVARATKKKNALHIMSTQASFPVEEINEVRGTPVWYQLYTTNQFEVTKQAGQARRGRRLSGGGRHGGHPRRAAIPRPRPRLRRYDTRTCADCHAVDEHGNPRPLISTKPMFGGIDTQGPGPDPGFTDLGLREATEGCDQDEGGAQGHRVRRGCAALAVQNGADGLIVSNHGGRSIESGRATLESLPEVVRGVAGRIPVLVDGGVRRGTDAFKALALGASAVGIGRPYAWGLAAFGQDGVERVLDILNVELRLAMVGCGARSVAEISPASLIDTMRK